MKPGRQTQHELREKNVLSRSILLVCDKKKSAGRQWENLYNVDG